MKCSDVMKRNVLTAHPDDSLQAVAWNMLKRGVSFVPVVDGEHMLKGGLSDRALMAHVVAAARLSGDIKAIDVAHELPTVGPDEEHGVVEDKMRAAGASRAAVVSADGHFLGAITLVELSEKCGSAEAGNMLKARKDV